MEYRNGFVNVVGNFSNKCTFIKKIKKEDEEEIVRFNSEANSISSISRLTGFAKTTVLRVLNESLPKLVGIV